MHDPVNNPSHYCTDSGLQAINVIEAFELNYHLGNAVKYILRAGKKDNEIQDLKKAAWYLARHIADLEASNGKEVDTRCDKAPTSAQSFAARGLIVNSSG